MAQEMGPPHMKSKLATVARPWIYENPTPEGQFSSGTSYGPSQTQPTEIFQDPSLLSFVQTEEQLFPLEPVVPFQSQRVISYSQPPEASLSSSYAVGSSSPAMLPPISTYGHAPIMQPPPMPTTLPNPFNQSPYLVHNLLT